MIPGGRGRSRHILGWTDEGVRPYVIDFKAEANSTTFAIVGLPGSWHNHWALA
jgi:hypothetical protein